LLESRGFEVLLVQARQLHNVPGRKTDMIDCQWIQQLHSCGLLRGSFRPEEAICALRALHRGRENFLDERKRAVQRIQKALDQMNIQIHKAVTDITGKTGMSILRAIVEGRRDAAELAALRDSRCRKSKAEFVEYLTGNWREEHLFNLELELRHYDYLSGVIAEYESKLEEMRTALQPPSRREESVPPHPNPKKERATKRRGEQSMRTVLWRFSGVDLSRIDGISAEASLAVLTEVGLDLSKFPTEAAFVSWLRLAPKTGFSAGKPIKQCRNGMGATRVANKLRMCAQSLQRSPTALGASFRRVQRRKGFSVAIFATARKLAQLVYRMLRYGTDYVDIGAEAYEAQFEEKRLRGLRANAKTLGFTLVRSNDTEAAVA